MSRRRLRLPAAAMPEIAADAFVLLPLDSLPAVGQGALGLECRADDAATRELLAALDDEATRAAVLAERAFLRALGGGCLVPIGAYGTLENTELFLTGGVFSPDGAAMIRYTAAGDCTKAAELGRNVAQVLLERGARQILEVVYDMPA